VTKRGTGRAGLLALLVLTALAIAGCSSHHKSAVASGSDSPSAATGSSASSGSAAKSSPVKSSSARAKSGGTSTAKPSGSVSSSGGLENQQPPSGVEKCTFSSAAAVQTAFATPAPAETVDATPIGNPRCTFVVRSSNVGPGGTITLTLSKSGSASDFARSKSQVPGAVGVSGIGDNAFYVPADGELRFIKSKTVLVIDARLTVPGQAQPKAAQLKSDVLQLGRSIAIAL
jgi:hypothetical protein